MAKYRLSYYDAKGRAEAIRLLFHYMDQPFEDHRFPLDQWPNFKKHMPWGRVPILQIGDKIVSQSVPICRYLGKLAGLAGNDTWEDLQMDMMADCALDILPEFNRHWYEKDETLKRELKEKFVKEAFPYYLSRFDKRIQDNGGYLVNGKLCWVDLLLISHCWMYTSDLGYEVTDGYPNLKSLQDKVTSHPKLKHYIQTLPSTTF